MTVVLRRHKDTREVGHPQPRRKDSEPALFTRRSGTCSLQTGALSGVAPLMAQWVKNLPAAQVEKSNISLAIKQLGETSKMLFLLCLATLRKFLASLLA